MNKGSSTKNTTFEKLCCFLASGLGSGFSPIAPGTAGSLALLLIWYPLAHYAYLSSWVLQILLCLVVFALGLFCSQLVLKTCSEEWIKPKNGKVDPQFIVIDEWAGMLASLVFVSPDKLWQVALAFLLFRFFDVLKPGPVKWAESLNGAWGIMLDDLIAGAFAAIVLQTICIII